MHLRREHQTWTFRRRVPRDLQARLGRREIYRSLSTSCKREAKKLASVLYAASEEVFRLALDESITDEDLRAAARLWLDTPRWRDRLRMGVDDLLPGALRRERAELPRRLVACTDEEAEHFAMPPATVEEMEAWSALESAGYWDPGRADIQRMRAALLTAVTEYVEKRFQSVFHPEHVAASDAGGMPVPSPLFSTHTEDFLTDKSRSTEEHRGHSEQTRKQVRATFRLWTELVGEKPVREYTGADAGSFRELILRLPASHGKSRTPITALEAIAKADDSKQPVRRLAMKTAKRHFSALSQYWTWLRPRGHVDANIFAGFSFPGARSTKRKRSDWSPAELDLLFRSERWRRDQQRDTAEWWLPVIALFSGMRLEEICRLRPNHDLKVIGGVPCFLIQPQPGWNPKSEAGERIIPVHAFLVDLGLMELVERRQTEGVQRLFPDLVPGGPDGKLGYEFSRQFSRYKRTVGVTDPKVVFHSFRHTFRTVLESTDLKESWIDAVMGHEGEKRSEGRTYTKRVSVKRLAEVVQAFESPLPLAFLMQNGD